MLGPLRAFRGGVFKAHGLGQARVVVGIQDAAEKNAGEGPDRNVHQVGMGFGERKGLLVASVDKACEFGDKIRLVGVLKLHGGPHVEAAQMVLHVGGIPEVSELFEVLEGFAHAVDFFQNLLFGLAVDFPGGGAPHAVLGEL